MSDKDQQTDKSGFSLQDEIKKRKTQEVQRAIEQKKIDEARGDSPAKNDPRRASQTASAAPSPASDSRRTSQTVSAAQSAADPRRATQTSSAVSDPKRATQTTSAEQSSTRNDQRRTSQIMSAAPSSVEPGRATQTTPPVADPRRATQSIPSAVPTVKRPNRAALIAAGAGTLVIVILIGTFLIAANINANSNTVLPTSTLPALPTVSASDVLDYLRKVAVPISNLRKIPVDHAVWAADEEIQFDVQRGTNKATFIILSYPSHNHAVGDSFQAEKRTNLKDWTIGIISNVMILTSPDANSDIAVEVASHLTSYLIAPYRPFLPPPTPQPTATAAGTEQASG